MASKLPTPEEFVAGMKARKQARQEALAKFREQPTLHPIAPIIAAALQAMKDDGATKIEARPFVAELKRGGLATAEDFFKLVEKIISVDFGLTVLVKWPTEWAMPYRLPRIANGKIVDPTILKEEPLDPEEQKIFDELNAPLLEPE